MRPPAPWKNDFEINKLQKERDHWRHEAHSKQTLQSWEKSFSQKKPFIGCLVPIQKL